MKPVYWYLAIGLGFFLGAFYVVFISNIDRWAAHDRPTREQLDSIHNEIRHYKLDSLRLELAIIEADMRNDSALQAIRNKIKHTKP